MSWFSTGLDTLNQLTEKVQKATETVQKAIPIDKEMLAKLTLNTDEMKAEREFNYEEMKRKAASKELLSGMYPWETRDPERDILVEECKDAILSLSHNEMTFFGPYEIPAMDVKKLPDKDSKDENEEDKAVEEEVKASIEAVTAAATGGGTTTTTETGDDVEDSAEDGEKVEADGEEGNDANEEEGPVIIEDQKPSEDALEKLKKLEPLPPLLQDFDLDSHVGLIQKLLSADPQLVKMQSSLSGGGDREKVFWHNYFFHVAYTRYEAGLSIDEIWSYPSDESASGGGTTTTSNEAGPVDTEGGTTADKSGEGVHQSGDSMEGGQSGAGTTSAPTTSADNDPTSIDTSTTGAVESVVDNVTSGIPDSTDFELVGDSDVVVDAELDELEAEIARELED